eukprot:NODE_1_length_95616_cov_0.657642.p32 type:complete len:322 gc:universal NODE_1_length_95616_cov_0.657642:36585-35620(-)
MISICFKNKTIHLNYWSSLPIDGKKPYILLFHALTGHCNANEWWSINKLYRRFCCICFTIPSSPYHSEFSEFSISEENEIIYRALKKLNVYLLKSVIGGSLGGFYALDFAQKYPSIVENCVCLSTAAKATDWLLCWNECQRQALFLPNGMALARMIAMLSYRSPQSFDKFDNNICDNRLYAMNGQVDTSCKEDLDTCVDHVDAVLKTPSADYLEDPHPHAFASWSYLHYQAQKFNTRFKKKDYLKLLENMDRFKLKGDILVPTLSISFSTDILFPPHHVEAIQNHCTNHKSKHFAIESELGHDSFLVDTNLFIEEMIQFLK